MESFNEVLQLSGSIAVDFFDKLASGNMNMQQFLQSTLRMLEKLAIQAAILGTGPLAGLFGTASTVAGGTGGLMGLLGNLFGGGRADGGDVSAGKAFLIGERGPEILMPKGCGHHHPEPCKLRCGGQHQVSNNHVINVTVNANGGDALTNQDLAEQVGRAVQTR